MYDYLYTKTRQKLGRSLTEASQNLHISFTEASQKLHRSFTEALEKLHGSFREFPHHCSLKVIVYRIVFQSKPESFTAAAMQRRFRWTCPVCGRPDLKNIRTHVLQVHALPSEERKPYLKQAQVSSWQPRVERSPHMTVSYMNVEKPGQKRENKVNIRHPQKDQEQQRVRHLWQPNPVQNSTSAINSHFWLWVPHKAGKYILSNKFWKKIVSCMKSKRVFAFFGTTINGKNVTKS